MVLELVFINDYVFPPPMAPSRNDLMERYEELQRKHDLPSYALMLVEFDIDTIPNDTTHLVREVTKKIFDRTDSFRKILEALLQPDGITDMFEADALGALGHEEISAILRELMRLDRQLLAAELDNGEEAYARFIRDGYTRWLMLKPRIAKIIEKLEISWTQAIRAKRDLNYFG
jgi:hypothetical protein